MHDAIRDSLIDIVWLSGAESVEKKQQLKFWCQLAIEDNIDQHPIQMGILVKKKQSKKRHSITFAALNEWPSFKFPNKRATRKKNHRKQKRSVRWAYSTI